MKRIVIQPEMANVSLRSVGVRYIIAESDHPSFKKGSLLDRHDWGNLEIVIGDGYTVEFRALKSEPAIKYTLIPLPAEERVSLAAFAEKHELEMVVREAADHFRASFKDCGFRERHDSPAINLGWGCGKTPEAAIENYAERIRGRMLAVNVYGADKRREIQCPYRWEESCNQLN